MVGIFQRGATVVIQSISLSGLHDNFNCTCTPPTTSYCAIFRHKMIVLHVLLALSLSRVSTVQLPSLK